MIVKRFRDRMIVEEDFVFYRIQGNCEYGLFLEYLDDGSFRIEISLRQIKEDYKNKVCKSGKCF